MRLGRIGLLVIVSSVLLLVYGIGFRAPGFGLFHDDGIYLVTAKSLAEGTGYRIVSLPDPIPETKYPPLFSLALCAFWKILPRFPQNIPLLKLVPLLSTALWLWLIFVYFRGDLGSPSKARCIALLTAASPTVVLLSVTFFSETMFACLLTATLLVLLRICKAEATPKRELLLASALAAAAILTRMAGLPLILAGTGALLARRKFGAALGFLLSTAALVSPWIEWSSRHMPIPGSLEAYYSGLNYANWNLLTNFTWQQKYSVIAQNLAASLISPGFLMGIRLSGWGLLVALLLAGFVAYGFLLDLAKGISVLTLFMFLYAGMLLIWVYPPGRFFVPVLPYLLFFGYAAVAHFLNKVLRLRSGQRAAAWLCVLVLVPFLARALFLQARGTYVKQAACLPYVEDLEDWDELASPLRWVSQNTRPDAVLLGNLDPLMYLLTGRRSIRGYEANPFELSYVASPRFPLGSPSQFVDNVFREQVDYVVREPSPGFGERKFLNELIDGLVSEYPEAFTLLKQGSDSNYRIYEVDRTRLAAKLEGNRDQP